MTQTDSVSLPPGRTEVLSRLQGLLADMLALESGDAIHQDSRLVGDLQVDSLGMVDLVTLVEEAYAIKLASSTDLTAIKTVGDIADLVLEHLGRKAAA